MTYPEAVRYLYSLGNELRGAKLRLERIAALLDALDHPERGFESVHIAGTNGKGSTAAMIEAGLRAAGLRTGLYTSPHLARINERIRVNGAEISDDDFAASFDAVHGAIEQLLAREALDGHPTYFECVTAMAFRHLRSAGVERAVVEVGLGGTLDATNVIVPRVAVITPIDFDHEALLGRGAESITAEKAGILKPGVPAVFAPQHPQAEAVLEARALELGIAVVHAGREWRVENVAQTDGYYRFSAMSMTGREILAELKLAGEHQVTNALVAIAALDVLGISAKAMERGLREARWPGRLEAVAQNPLVVLDGAHNPAAARALARFVEKHYRGRRVWLIYAAMRDKAVDEVAGVLFPLAYKVILTRVPAERAVSPQALLGLVSHHHRHIEVTESLAEALEQARRAAAKTDIILVTGSLYLVGEAKRLLA